MTRHGSMQESVRLLVPSHVTALVPGDTVPDALRHAMPNSPSDVQLRDILRPMSHIQVREA